jgi:putative transposase
MIGLCKTELVRNTGPWRGLDDLELATLEWSTGSTTGASSTNSDASHPAEFDDLHYRQSSQATRPRITPTSLRETR